MDRNDSPKINGVQNDNNGLGTPEYKIVVIGPHAKYQISFREKENRFRPDSVCTSDSINHSLQALIDKYPEVLLTLGLQAEGINDCLPS